MSVYRGECGQVSVYGVVSVCGVVSTCVQGVWTCGGVRTRVQAPGVGL